MPAGSKRYVFIGIIVVVVALIYQYVIKDVAVRGLLRVFWNKMTEKVLPPQSVHWLASSFNTTDQLQAEIWKNLQITEEYEGKRPNIILIVADDLGVNDISGGAGVKTPFIDSIAQNGLNFSQAYSSQATCAPSRAALYTGRYPTSIGYEFTPIPKFFAKFMAGKRPVNAPQPIYHEELYDLVPDMFEIHMPSGVPTIAEELRSYGYSNYFIGKWDGSYRPDENSPLNRGYDETLAMLIGSTLYTAVDDPSIVASNNISVDQFMKKFLPFKVQYNNGPAFRPSEYLTDYLGKETSALIKRLGEKRRFERQETKTTEESSKKPDDPWFITVAFTAPHNPFQALISDYEKPEIQAIPSFIGRIYASMIHSLDRNVGRILEALKETSQYDSTIVIFTSDNGAAPYVGLQHLNAPYRGWKATLFEGGIRIPFFLQWPSKLPSSTVVKDMIIHLDIFPTLLSIVSKGIERVTAAASSSSSLKLDGKNILSNFLISSEIGNGENENELMQSESVVGNSTDSTHLKELEKQYNRIFFWRSGNYSSIRFYHYKLQIHSYQNKIWFYNLLLDPTERRNIFDEMSSSFLVPKHGWEEENHKFPHGVKELSAYISLHRIKYSSSFESDLLSSLHATLIEGSSGELRKKESFFHLVMIYLKLQEINSQQSKPIWPALVELPICVDKPQIPGDLCTFSDEYIIWAN
jgi:arylsulfatase A-like enzyme